MKALSGAIDSANVTRLSTLNCIFILGHTNTVDEDDTGCRAKILAGDAALIGANPPTPPTHASRHVYTMADFPHSERFNQ